MTFVFWVFGTSKGIWYLERPARGVRVESKIRRIRQPDSNTFWQKEWHQVCGQINEAPKGNGTNDHCRAGKLQSWRGERCGCGAADGIACLLSAGFGRPRTFHLNFRGQPDFSRFEGNFVVEL